MKSRDSRFIPKKRRGLSSIVGALIFVVLMVATFAVLGVALDSQTDIVDTSRDVADTGLKKQLEAFQINSVVQNPGQSLKVEAKNKGQNPTEIFTMIITNSSDIANGYPTETFDIPYATSLLPPGHESSIDVAETLDLKMKLPSPLETDTYDIKLVSSLGIIQKYKIECRDVGSESVCGPGVDPTGPGGLAAQLFLDGPNGVNTKTTTVIMFVTNTGDVTLSNVAPVFGNPTPDCDDMWTAAPTGGLEDISPCDLDAVSPTTLVPGQTYLFKWDGTVAGEIDDVFTFCNQASGEEPDATPVTSSISCDSMTVINPNDCGGCEGGGDGGETIILIDDLLIKPSLFLTIPSPYGSVGSSANDDVGLWGVQVANPLNFTISVSKVTITAFAPGANSNLKIFDPSGNNTNVSPGPAGGLGDWIADAENVLVWRNFDNPIILGPYQSETFMFKVKPWTNNVDLEAIIVQTSIFSTSGSFGKAAYQTTMFPGGGLNDAPVASVYLSTEVDSRESQYMYGHINNMTNGTAHEFTAVMADLDHNEQSYIAAGSEFIINVPREWTDVTVDPDVLKTTNIWCCNATHPSIIEHSDQSIQIIGILKEDIGTGGKDAATITFSATAPEERTERLYIMYILGNGLTQDLDQSVGPLSEIILHVIGNQTGFLYN
jgi:hypothetical protein